MTDDDDRAAENRERAATEPDCPCGHDWLEHEETGGCSVRACECDYARSDVLATLRQERDAARAALAASEAEIERYRQRSRDEDTARIRLNHARIEQRERAAELEQQLAASEARVAALRDGLSFLSRITPDGRLANCWCPDDVSSDADDAHSHTCRFLRAALADVAETQDGGK